jgi:large subunit ribosomal protein L22
VRLRNDKLKQLAGAAGLTVEKLAETVERPGLKGRDAASAVRNWLAGRPTPACKAADVAALARALGCTPKDFVRFVSSVRGHRGSPRKAKLVVDLVRGKGVDQALNLLSFTTKRAAVDVKKALNAAIADAEQAQADVTQLFVAESTVDDGPRMKRFQPKDRGRAHPIIKRFSHITIGVQEREAR